MKLYMINTSVLISIGALFISTAYYLNQFTLALTKVMVVGML